MKHASLTPPATNELELSVFGPGYGECAVMHLGNGNWLVVDSCNNEEGGIPVALEYLEQIGVDAATAVKLVIATHWHLDHTRGLAAVVQACSAARFACSAALASREFITLLQVSKAMSFVDGSSGVSEFLRILEVLRKRSGQADAAPDDYALAGMILYRSDSVEVRSLSPSSHTMSSALSTIARLIPSNGQPIRRFPRVEPNDLSVVLQVSSGAVSFLLGGDLEACSDRRRGWGAVIESPIRSKDKCCSYKVAHHGSPNADAPEIWSELLVDGPTAIVTPFELGSVSLPTAADVKRIIASSRSAYCTSQKATRSPSKRDTVDKIMNDVALTRRVYRRLPGHVRVRVELGGPHEDQRIEVFAGAQKL